MNLIGDAAFFIGFFFLASMWYAQEKLTWNSTINMFGGKVLNTPEQGTIKHILRMSDFTWGFGGLMLSWVALSLSRSLVLFPMYIAIAATICLGVQASRKLNKWVYVGFAISLLTVISSAAYSF